MSENAYKQAGVDVEAGYESVRLIKDDVKKTAIEGVLGGIGGFGGLFEMPKNYENPVLVSGTDGVGTKIRVAFLMDKHDTIGQDCVAMCKRHCLFGCKAVVLPDYIAIGKNVPEKVAQIVKGVADGCVLSGCALVGGETAEHPGMMPEDEYDVAGFSVGVVEKSKITDGKMQKQVTCLSVSRQAVFTQTAIHLSEKFSVLMTITQRKLLIHIQKNLERQSVKNF